MTFVRILFSSDSPSDQGHLAAHRRYTIERISHVAQERIIPMELPE
jgi:hypothetical protein